MSTILGETLSPQLCGPIYAPPFIPKFGEESAFSLITVCLEFTILLFLLSCILRKKWYQCHGDYSRARSLLLPFYDSVIYYYCIITLLRIVFYLIQFIYETTTQSNTQHPHFAKPWWIILGDTIGIVGIIGLEVFILFLLMQTSAGTKAYKRAWKGTICVCVIELIIILSKNIFGKIKSDYTLFCIGELFEELLLFCIFIGVFIYSYFYQIVKNRKRQRNKILYVYILLLCIMFLIVIIAYILLIFRIDGYCLDIIDQYLYRLLFPWIAFITIRSDSEFWRLLLLSWQTSSTIAIGENADSNNNNQSTNVWDKIKIIFGIDYSNNNNSSSSNNKSFLNPLIDALSMGVKMVDFTELQETSDPIAMGSTATVSKAKLAGEIVAIKVFIFDELSIEVVSEFFRESLLISDLHHDNIVEFKGACLRPPELCLVYEYCSCGDLTHLLLTQYFHSNFLHNNEEKENDRQDPKTFIIRLKMLIHISRGMTRLHNSRVIHRDLKTSNILVHYKSGKYIAKVCDFGSARKILHNINKSKSTDSTYTPPKQLVHAKSSDFVSENDDQNGDLSNKQVVKSINTHTNRNKRGITIKKHEIIIENKPKHNKYHKPSASQDMTNIKLQKQDSKHGRSMTVNIGLGIFGRKIKKRPGKNNNNNNNNNNNERMNRIMSNSMNENENENKIEEEEEAINQKHKASINYDDMEEEEKYDQPEHQSYQTPGNNITDEFDDDFDNKTEATDVLTDLNSENMAAKHHRDPMKLAFSVSPILLTTQVGTLAFMAPEILSHVNIGALSGGWVNKKDNNDNDNKMDDNDNDDDNEHKYEQQEQKYENNLQISNKNIPIAMSKNNIPMNDSGNHLKIGNEQITHHSTTTSNWTTTTGSAVSESQVVIKIDTKTDPNYQNNNNNNNNNNLSIPSSSETYTNPKSIKTIRTAPIQINQNNNNKSMEMKPINRMNHSNPNLPTSRQKRFSREYINKHRELSNNTLPKKPLPKKPLPPAPLKKRGMSSISNSFTLRKFFSSTNNDNNDLLNWQNRDIFYYNQPLPPIPTARSSYNNNNNNYNYNRNKYTPIPQANNNNLNINNNSIALKPPHNHVPSNSYNSNYGNNNNYFSSKPLPNLPNETNDARFSTMSSRGRHDSFKPKNINKYLQKELPPNPPKRKSKPKTNYFSRNRTQSKFSVISNRKSTLENNDDIRSVIYETQKFEIVYEASNQTLYDDSVDVYSFGVIMWEAGLCDRIYNQMDMKQIRDMVCQGKRMKIPKYKNCNKENNGLSNDKYNISKSVYDAFIELINDCWAQSPIDRPKFYEIEKRLELIEQLHLMKIDQNKNMKKHISYHE